MPQYCGKTFQDDNNCLNIISMKKTSAIRVHLGLNQADMAKILGVSRSHYSMHELGKRPLPLGSMQALAALLVQIDDTQSKEVMREQPAVDVELVQLLEKKYAANVYKLKQIKLKIECLKRKYKATVGAAKVCEVLQNQKARCENPSESPTDIGLSNKNRSANYLTQLVLLDIEYKTHEARDLILQYKIIKCGRGLINIELF